MLFNSLTYALFFALFIAIYFAPFMRKARAQCALVLIGSYIFYAAWDWRFLGLIILTTLTSYTTARIIEGHQHRFVLVLNILLNVGMLAFFKYFNFFAANLVRLLGIVGWELDWVFVNILLPVGISFYTFQAIGYTVDVWRGEIKAERNIVLFASFIAYFPQLVAGPIERASHLMPQLAKPHRWDYARAVSGMRMIVWGMFKKVVIADSCAEIVMRNYSENLAAGNFGLNAYIAAFLFLIQIYCDFSGYCEIAKGSARILGVELTDNFRRPYFSRSVPEFWHRWHISLMRWFTDYIYIPLGGSRRGRWRTCCNAMIVFALSGLWHGATWGFVIWGLICGIFYCIERALHLPSYKDASPANLLDIPRIFLTFSLYLIPMVFFRVESVSNALRLCVRIVPWSIVAVVCVYLFGYIFKGALVRLMKHSATWKRNVLLAGVGAYLVFFAVSPMTGLNHLYIVLTLIAFPAEWVTRACNEKMYPLPTRHQSRTLCYFGLYLLIMAYGVFHLPPALEAKQFIYFAF
ncbi:MAG: MBOAT family protein [Prevotella sp.]|nr:MBOAT family protein [Prevotella sp.]MCM1074578.1 MBOAT family protein [Ruminococcus sp.]